MLTWGGKEESAEKKTGRESTSRESRGERQFARPSGPMERREGMASPPDSPLEQSFVGQRHFEPTLAIASHRGLLV